MTSTTSSAATGPPGPATPMSAARSAPKTSPRPHLNAGGAAVPGGQRAHDISNFVGCHRLPGAVDSDERVEMRLKTVLESPLQRGDVGVPLPADPPPDTAQRSGREVVDSQQGEKRIALIIRFGRSQPAGEAPFLIERVGHKLIQHGADTYPPCD